MKSDDQWKIHNRSIIKNLGLVWKSFLEVCVKKQVCDRTCQNLAIFLQCQTKKFFVVLMHNNRACTTSIWVPERQLPRQSGWRNNIDHHSRTSVCYVNTQRRTLCGSNLISDFAVHSIVSSHTSTACVLGSLWRLSKSLLRIASSLSSATSCQIDHVCLWNLCVTCLIFASIWVTPNRLVCNSVTKSIRKCERSTSTNFQFVIHIECMTVFSSQKSIKRKPLRKCTNTKRAQTGSW